MKKGVAPGSAVRRVYRPFIVQGPAAWSDTWHAPRYAGGFHLHEGQDVLCRSGSPVLAATPGVVDFDTDRLGGTIARIVQADGGWWYYAHLSGWNTELRDGRSVHVGDVIGFCGRSGDAAVPHVHFGWYAPSGVARDPIRQLIAWLRAAERRLGVKTRPAASPVPDVGASELGIGSARRPSEGSTAADIPGSTVFTDARPDPSAVATLGFLGGLTLPLMFLVGWVGREAVIRRRRTSPD